MINVNLNNITLELNANTSYYEISKMYEREYNKKPYLVKAGGIVKELRRNAKDGEDIEFLFYDNLAVKDAYARTAIFIMLKAINDVYDSSAKAGVKLKNRNAYYFEIDDKVLRDEDIKKITKRYEEIVNLKIFIDKRTFPKKEALQILEQEKLEDVRQIISYSYRPKVNLRYIDNYVRYINGELLYDTSFIQYYKICKYHKGLLLFVSDTDDDKEVIVRRLGTKQFDVMNMSIDWAKRLNINTVGKLNKQIANNKFDDLIIMTESFQDKQIGDIADAVVNAHKKIVFIAGPSSSGKTSFSHRLMYHLYALDYKPHPIACDNFFKNREDTPRDEKGDYDFESIDALDVNLLNDTLSSLLSGEETLMPTFDFIAGEKIFKGDKYKIGKNDVIILEGIHCLNPKLVTNIDNNDIFKIYVSALTEVSIDNANRIATSDLRLIRRIVRDSRTRGVGAKDTIKRWASVRQGEAKAIFPYQENADIYFNSALIYEFSVLKNKALAQLFDLSEDEEVGIIARRLIKILNYFLGAESDAIPRHSIIREFIGQSIMEVG